MMQKITNQQAAGQTMLFQQAGKAESLPVQPSVKGAKDSSKEEAASFGAQLAQAAMLTQQQPQVVQANLEAPLKAEVSGKNQEQPTISKEQAKAAPDLLKASVSSKTVSAMTGLKPWSKEWVFEGEMPEINPSKLQAEQAAPNRALARPTRGDAGAMPAIAGAATEMAPSQLEMQTMREMHKQIVSGREADQAEGAVTKLAPDMQNMAGLEAMGGVILENTQEPAARPVKGKSQQLSGSEFLNTLSLVKDGNAPLAKPQTDAQLGQQGQGGAKDAKSNLRLVSGGLKGKKSQFEELTAHNSLQNLAAPKAGFQMSPTAAVVTGQVVKGANAEDRFTSEALMGVSSGIRNLSTQGGGEMRIRLRPENLGELHVRVVTDGKNVGLQIQASDERSKKILEDSMSYLKESMASQSLTLGSVDLTVAQAHNAGADHRGDQQQPGSHSQMFQDMNGRNPGQQGQNGSGREAWGEVDRGLSPRVAQRANMAAAASASAGGRVSSSRLDVRA